MKYYMKEEQNKIGGIKVEDFLFRYFFLFNLYMYRIFFLAGTWGSYLDNNRIQDYSGRAIGHITKKHFQTTIDGSGNYYLD